jgi:hypothetical protein
LFDRGKIIADGPRDNVVAMLQAGGKKQGGPGEPQAPGTKTNAAL